MLLKFKIMILSTLTFLFSCFCLLAFLFLLLCFFCIGLVVSMFLLKTLKFVTEFFGFCGDLYLDMTNPVLHEWDYR